MSLGGLLGGLGVALKSAQAQQEARQKMQLNQLEMQRLQLENQHVQQQAQQDVAFAKFDGLQSYLKQNPDAGEQQPPSPYGFTPMGGQGGQAGQGAQPPLGIPGSRPMPGPPPQAQGGGNPLLGPIPPGMGPQGAGMAPPQQQSPQSPMDQLAAMQPPTLNSVAQRIFQQKVRAGANPQDPMLMRYVQQTAPKAFAQAMETYKAQSQQLEARARIQEAIASHRDNEADRAESRAMREQEHADTLSLERSRLAQGQASKGWEVFQSKDGTLLRVNKDTGQVAKVDDPRATGLTKVGANGGGKDAVLDDATIKQMAGQYLAGDKSVMQNLGRGAQGSENIVRLRKEIAAEAAGARLSPKDIATKMAEFDGQKAGERALGTRSAQMGMAVDESLSVMPLARQASAALARTNFTPLNKAIQSLQSGSSNPALARFVAANQSLVTVYARAMSPTGVPNVTDKEHAREMLNTAQSNEAYNAVLDQMQAEMDAARRAPEDVRVELGGGGASPAPAKSSDGWGDLQVH